MTPTTGCDLRVKGRRPHKDQDLSPSRPRGAPLLASHEENEWPREDHTNPFAQPERTGIVRVHQKSQDQPGPPPASLLQSPLVQSPFLDNRTRLHQDAWLSSITRAPCPTVLAARQQTDAPARHGGCQSICGIGWSALTDMAVLRGCVDKFVN